VAEVDRALSVLDGVVLVVSAVEAVQPQTRVLWRAVQRLRLPALFFVNKIDRRGAGGERVLSDSARRLTPAAVSLGTVRGLGTPGAAFLPLDVRPLAEALAAHDDAVLAACLDDRAELPGDWLRERLAAHVRNRRVYPVYFGSAVTGAGVDALVRGLTGLLQAAAGDSAGPLSGRVFKIERAAAGEKTACARLYSGTVAVRDQVRFGPGRAGKVTAVSVFGEGAGDRDRAAAGQLARLSGLAEIQVGDVLGTGTNRDGQRQFAPPTLETVVFARDPRDQARLHAALTQLAEQDPLINVRRDDVRQEICLSLYGEIQKQVIEATLAADYRLAAGFRETTPLCVERPVRSGAAEEILHAPGNPFLATLGIRIEPAPAGTGTGFRFAVGHQAVPLHIYKNMAGFEAAMRQPIAAALRQGLRGWPVTDARVSLVRSGYSPTGPRRRAGRSARRRTSAS
jgi:ribosomal protection tetracycline resistance protein